MRYRKAIPAVTPGVLRGKGTAIGSGHGEATRAQYACDAVALAVCRVSLTETMAW